MPPLHHILYVDDEPDLLEITKLYLEKDGQFSVDCTLSGSDALIRIAAGQYDAVVSDYQMPGMNGITLLKKVRESNQTLPFILFTGKGREEVVIEAINSGVDFYLQKGGDPRAQYAELALKVRTAAERRKAERAQKESEERYRSLVETTGTGYVILDSRGRVITANQEYIRLTGRSAFADIEGREVTEWTAPYDLDRNAREVEQCITTGYVRGLEIDYRWPDGTIQPVEINASVIGSGQGLLILTLCRDISQRRSTEESLQKSEESVRTMIEQSPLSTQVLTPDGRVVKVNRAFEKLWGLTLENLKDYNILRDEQLEILGIMPFIKKGFSGESCLIPAVQYDPGRVNGKAMPAKWVLGHIYPVRDPAGTIRNVVVVHEDITEQRNAENALKASEERYRAIADFTFDWEYWIAPDGKFIYMSPSCERLSGYRAEEFMDDPGLMIAITHPEDQERLRNHFATAGSLCSTTDALEYRIITKGGDIRWMGHVCQPVFNARGECLGRRGSNRDITEHRKAENEVQDQRNFLDAIIEQSPNPIWISDERGTLIRLNKATRTMLQITPEEVVGKYNVLADTIVEEQGKMPLVRSVFEEGRSVTFDIEYDSSRLKTLKLERFASLFLKVTIFPIRDSKGTITNVVVEHENITKRHLAEEALKKSRTQLAEAMDLAHLVNWEYDVTADIFTFDDRFYTFYGTTAEREGGNQMPAEVYAKNFVHPDDRHLVAEEIHKAIEATDPGFISEVEHRIIRRDGEIRHIVVRFGITQDENGRTIKTHGANQDITDRKQAEELLHAERDRIQRYLDVAGVMLTVLDREGTVILINRKGCEILGYSSEEILGRNWFDMFLPEDFRSEVKGIFDKILSGDPAVREYYENPVLTRTNEKRIIAFHYSFVSGPDGITGVLFSGEDITERKKAEDALKESRALFVSLFNTTPVTILLTNPEDGRILSVNDTGVSLFGYTREEMEGNSTLSLGIWVNPEERNVQLAGFKEAGFVRDIETKIRSKSGQIYQVIFNSVATSYQGRAAILTVIIDITERKRIESALKESEDQFRSIVENAPVGIFHSLPEGKILDVNPAFARIFGYESPEELVEVTNRRGIIETFYVDPDRRPAIVREVAESGVWHTYNNLYRRKDGRIIHGMTSFRSYYNPASRREELEGFVIDISEIKQIEDELRRSEGRLSTLVKTIPDLVWLKDRDGVYLSCNTMFERFFGAREADIIGKTDYDFVSRELADFFREHDRIAMAAGKPSMNEEWITFADDGHDALLETIKTPMVDARGDVIGILGIGRDVTERKRIENVLKDAKEYSEKLIQTANAMVVALDTKGTITLFNPAAEAITGYTSAELSGRNWFEVIVPKDRYPQVWEEFNRLLSGGFPKHFENPIRTKSGEERYIIWKNSELRKDEQIIGTISFGIDISERKQMEDSLQKSELKLRMAQTIARMGQWELDLVTNVLHWSEGIYEIFEMDPREFGASYETFLENIHPDDRARVDSAYKQSVKNRQPYEIIHRLLMKDGRIKWVNEICRTDYDSEGHPLRSIGIVQDISNIRQIESDLEQKNQKLMASYEQLAASEEELKNQFDALMTNERLLRISEERLIMAQRIAATGSWEYNLQTGTIWGSAEGLHIFGFPAVSGDFPIDKIEACIPERERVHQALVDLLSKEKEYNLEYLIHPADGSTEKFIHSIARLEKDPQGKPLRVIGVIQDITERKQVETALRESEERFRAIFNATFQFTGVMNTDGILIAANQSALDFAGVTSPEVINRPFWDTPWWRGNETRVRELKDAILRAAAGEFVRYEVELQGALDTRGLFDFSIKPVFDDRGNVVLLIPEGRDITERKLAENALMRVNRKLNILNDITRRDLTSQIFVLKSYLELVKLSAAGQDPVLTKLEKTQKVIQSINDISEFTRDYQDMGEAPPRWQNVKMALLYGISHVVLGNIRHRFETNTLEIFADPLLEKAFQGLIENTIAHGKTVTRIRVFYREIPEGIVIIYEDDGSGIPQEMKERIFSREEGTHASVRGLVFVREILDLTGIAIRETGEPGKGVRFEITVLNGQYRFGEKS